MFTNKTLAIFIIVFFFGFVAGAPMVFNGGSNSIVDAVVSAWGGGDGNGGGSGGSSGGGGNGGNDGGGPGDNNDSGGGWGGGDSNSGGSNGSTGGDGCGGCGGGSSPEPSEPSEPNDPNPPSTPGCLDPNATNYNPNATVDDGSCVYPQPISCAGYVTFTANPTNLGPGGGNVTLTWNTSKIASVKLDGSAAPLNGSAVRNVTGNTTFNLQVTGDNTTAGNTVNCPVSVTVTPKQPISCAANVTFTANPTALGPGGGDVTLNWTTTDISGVLLDGSAAPLNGSAVRNVTANKTFTLQVTGNNTTSGNTVNCQVSVTVSPKQPISCPANVTFTANPTSLPFGGGDVTLTWNTTKIASVKLDGVAVALNDSAVRSITNDTTFNLEVTGDSTTAGNTEICPVTVNVGDPTPDPVSCAANATFTSNPTALGVGGGDVTLTWNTTKIASVKLDGVAVALNDSAVRSITNDTTFNLEITGDASTTGNTEICPLTVPVSDTNFTCDGNVTFTSNYTTVDEGAIVRLNWNVTGATSVAIDPSVGTVSASGTQEVTVNQSTTYTLTASNGFDTIHCPLSVTTRGGGGGGGGGGSSSPRCEFLVSDRSIASGEEVTLSWETSRGREVVIYEGDEDDDNKIYETDDDDEVDEGSIKVRPTEDTKYTLVVSRGSSDRDCVVRVEVEEEEIVLASSRVAGISLTQVPYTGFEAGPMLTFIFYALLAVWGLFVAYTFVIRENKLFGFALPGAFSRSRILTDDVSSNGSTVDDMPEAAKYVESAITPTRNTILQASAPANLPTGDYAPVVGYASKVAEVASENEISDEMKELEDRAHESRVLLSSDAMRHLVSVCPREISRLAFLDQIIAEAKVSYPTEDGWIVLNLDRMCEITKNRKAAATTVAEPQKVEVAVEKKITAIPQGSGSLAEAIVTGNIVAAYQMIGHRPMIALADAAADLDNVFRARKGEQVYISDMLAKETSEVATEKIEAAIAALTSALDGTYTNEAEAVKMAIMKATKVLA